MNWNGNLPKPSLLCPRTFWARNAYGFSAREMRKIAQNLHAKAKEEIRSGHGSEFRGSIEEAL